MSVLKNRLIWVIVFFTLFIFSQDFWNWDGAGAFGLFHIPDSVYYLAVLQFILAASIFLFSKTFWQTGDGEED